MSAFRDRLKNAINAFTNKDPTPSYLSGGGSYIRPDRPRFSLGNDRSIVNAIYNRIAMDVAAIDIRHIKLDEQGRYSSDVNDGLNECLNLSANLDQTGRALIQDIVISMFDEGVVAVLPIDTERNRANEISEIYSLRTGKITEWYPSDIKAKVYDERDGQKKERIWKKKESAIIENPMYTVVNDPNSIAKRLVRKMNLLDAVDEQLGSGKLDLIIQLPYLVRTPGKKQQAEEKRREIERQLSGSQYGIAYIDSAEKITQLNRPVENQLLKQIEYYTNLLFSQLGITAAVMDGSADEAVMNNYYSRTIEPILSAITGEFKRKFLTRTAITQGHSIEFFRNQFKLVPMSTAAELADKLTRNEIMTHNEVRQNIFGLKPSDDPKADELRNSNLSQSNAEIAEEKTVEDGKENQNE